MAETRSGFRDSGWEGASKVVETKSGFRDSDGRVHQKWLRQNRGFAILDGRVHQKWLRQSRCFAILGWEGASKVVETKSGFSTEQRTNGRWCRAVFEPRLERTVGGGDQFLDRKAYERLVVPSSFRTKI